MTFSIPQRHIMESKRLFTSYWFYGDLHLLTSQFDREDAYILNNFLNLYSYGCDTNSFDLYFSFELLHKQMEMYTHCPFLDYRIIERSKQPITIPFLKKLIDDGWSLIVYVNRKGFGGYDWKFNLHQIMLYGYDDESEKLWFCDNGPTGKYMSGLSCDYDAFINGYQAIDKGSAIDTVFDFENHCYALKAKPCETYGLNFWKISQDIKTYLGLLPNEYAYIQNYDGIFIYDHIVSYLNDIINKKFELPSRMGSFAVLKDHKAITELLIDQLIQRNMIDKNVKNEYHSIVQQVTAIINLLLHYQLKHDSENLVRVVQIVKQVRDTEYGILTEMLRQIGT